MFNKTFKFEKISIAILLLISAIFCFASNNESIKIDKSTSRFIERKAEGWFFYNEKYEEEEKEEIKEKPTSSQIQPPTLSAEWVKENLDLYKKQMWSNPTIENVRAYMYLQRFAIDRSAEIARISKQAVIGDPFLDEISNVPSDSFANMTYQATRQEIRKKVLNKISQQSGLIFFFKGNEKLSQLQAVHLKSLIDVDGFTIMGVSVDGFTLPPTTKLSSYKVDKGQAQSLNILTYPALFMVTLDGDIQSIGQGVMSVNTILERIITAALRKKIINDKDARSMWSTAEQQTDLSSLSAQFSNENNKNNPKLLPATKLIELLKGKKSE